jgi:polyhydroxybutyrate depolymerase
MSGWRGLGLLSDTPPATATASHAHTASSWTARRLTFTLACLIGLLTLALSATACQRRITTSVSAPGATTGTRDVDGSLVSGGFTRTYHVHLPSAASSSRALPLIFAFHGGGGTGSGMEGLTHFNELADQQGFIVVAPDGYEHHWADGRGTTPPEKAGVDDVAFITALLDTLEQQYRIDTHRVYATGISNGGIFSFWLGCQLASRLAAIAPVAAMLATNDAPTCHPAHPMPLLMIHGSDDPIIPAAGGAVRVGPGGGVLSDIATVQQWATLDACAPTPTITTLPQLVNDGTQVRQQTYSGCAGGSAVIFDDILGGGHAWPGGLQYLPAAVIGKTSRNLDATTAIWAFFQRFTLP